MNKLLELLGVPLCALMTVCYDLVHNYVVAIVIFTALTKIILLPVSMWVQRNGIAMVRMMPELNRLKIKYFGDQETIAETLRNILEFDDFIAEAVSHRDEDFVGFVALLVFVARHFFEAVQTSLALGLSALGILTNPFKLVLHCLDAGVFFLLLEL